MIMAPALLYQRQLNEPAEFFVVESDPNTVLEAPEGSFAVNPANGRLYVKLESGESTWIEVAGSAAPGGANTQIQFNDSGAFDGSSDFTFDRATQRLTLAGTQRINAAEPRLLFGETGAAANAGLWDIDINAGALAFRTRSDVDGSGVTWMSATRGAGTAVSGLTFDISADPLSEMFFNGGADALGAGISFLAGNISMLSVTSGGAIYIDSAGTAQLSSDNITTVGAATNLELRCGANNDILLAAGTHPGGTGQADILLNVGTGASFIILGTQLGNFANDAAAAAGGVPVRGLYRNGSVVMTRVA